jgi:NAD(P)-dependent dehydrogenase (short-subunit alcohol dehydrogenase family)
MARFPARKAHGCAWVTGASGGIGAATALALSKRGWSVAITARRPEQLATVAAKATGKMHVAPADVTDFAQMQAAAGSIESTLGPIGLVIANAGIYIPVDARRPNPDDFKKTFDVNLMGVAHAYAAVVPGMIARGRGHFHVVSSATGFGGMPTASAYGASKAALINMTSCWKIELDRLGIGISLSTPGFVETPAQDDNAFPKPFMISADTAAQRIVGAVTRGGFETTFPRRFTWVLKAIYALPKPLHLPLIRAQTGWAGPGEPPAPTKSGQMG